MHKNAVKKRYPKHIKKWIHKNQKMSKKLPQMGLLLFTFWYIFGVFFAVWLQDGTPDPKIGEN